MEETEFDKFAQEYVALHRLNVRLSGEPPEFFAAYKVADTAAVLAEKGLGEAPRILDGARIPFPDRSFDLVFMACVLHHIDHADFGSITTISVPS